MIMKRSREEEEDIEIETLAMANYLVLLNHINQTSTSTTSSLDRVFKCKTCGRKFRSFQALGGHRASHKRPKSSISSLPSSSIKIKAKMHECSICGLEFEMGQALGGHMRRHRADMINKEHNTCVVPVSASVLKRSDSKRVNLWLDLNLTPYENDLKLGYQIMAPLFTHFI